MTINKVKPLVSIKTVNLYLSARTLNYIGLTLIILAYSAIIFPEEVIQQLTTEDGFFENIGAILFLFTSLVFFYGFWRNSEEQFFLLKKVNRSYAYMLLGILFFFVFAEEISWGQRIFNTESGAFFLEKNIQKETNLHNLKIFNSVDEFNVKRPWWDILSMSRLFRLFWFILCIALPVAAHYSKPFHSFFHKLGIPIFRRSTGLLLAFNYLLLKFFENTLSFEAEIVEIEECLTGLIFFIAAVDQALLTPLLNQKQSEHYVGHPFS